MESPQSQTLEEESIFPTVHNLPAYPCVVCGKPTTFRLDSLPICSRCAQDENL